jgi:hypothetical protein
MPPLMSAELTMPRYFFDIINGHRSIDNEGIDLADETEARLQGIVAAGAIFGEDGEGFSNGEAVTMSMRRADGDVFCTINFTICW